MGHWFFCCGTLTFLGAWEIFEHVILVMGIFLFSFLSWGIFYHVVLVMEIFFAVGNYWPCGFGHGNFFGHVILGMGILYMWFWSWEFFGHVILVMGIFWTRDFGHGNFFWTCSFGHGNFLGMWFWLWEFFGHGKFFLSWEIFDHVENLNETSLEFTWWGLVALI